MNKSPIYLFLHLAKTGGTTFVGHLYERMKFDEEFFDLGVHGNNFRKANNKTALTERTPDELDKLKIVVGHLVYWEVMDLFPEREPRLFMFMREPVSRVISHYTFDSSKVEESFAEWYKRWIHNQTYAFLCDHLRATSMDEVLQKLEQFWHIGFTENLAKSLDIIYPALGLDVHYVNRRVAGEPENTTKDLGYDNDRVIKKTYQATPEEVSMIERDHLLDTWLYQHLKANIKNGKYTKPSGCDANAICTKLMEL